MFLLTVQLIFRGYPMTVITLQFPLSLRIAQYAIVIFMCIIIIILYLFLYLFVLIAAVVYTAIIKFCTRSCCRHRFGHPCNQPFLWMIVLVLHLETIYQCCYDFIIHIWFKLSFSDFRVFSSISVNIDDSQYKSYNILYINYLRKSIFLFVSLYSMKHLLNIML